MGIKYPQVQVELVGSDGNVFAVLGKVKRAMRKAGLSEEQIAEFDKEAKSGDYDHALQTCMRYVDVS